MGGDGQPVGELSVEEMMAAADASDSWLTPSMMRAPSPTERKR